MSFLWPLAWILGVLALPITALYLIRTRLERKPVSTFLFWQHLTPQVYNNSLWRKLRRWISLALQLLFLLLLILAISQPLASWQSAKPASVILLLDASASMSATDVPPSRWNEAVKTAKRRIAQLRFFDEAMLIEAGDSPRVLCGWSRNKRALERALLTARPSLNAGDIRPAIALAHNLGDQRKSPEILLISDGVWDRPPAPEAMKGVQTHWIGREPLNAGLTLFGARRSLATPGEYQLVARVVAAGSATASIAAELEVRRNGVLMDVQPLTLEPGKPWQKTWEGSASDEVRFEARIVLAGTTRDDLSADNRAEARLAALRPVAVELVAPPNPFLDAALDSLPMVSVHRTWPVGNLGKTEHAGLVVFHRCVPPPGFQTTAAMLLIDPDGGGPWGKLNGPLDSALVSETLRDEPIMRFVSLDSVHLQKARDFTPAPGATLFATSFGKPLVFGQWDAGDAAANRPGLAGGGVWA